MKRQIMKLGQVFSRFQINTISLSPTSASIEISYTNYDAEAAWNLYIELVTRVTTQPLDDDSGTEKSALESIYSIFSQTREILKKYGRKAKSFTRIAIIVLNQIVRPFTSKWHPLFENDRFNDEETCQKFRKELNDLRQNLIHYAKLLANMASVDDLTEI